MLHFLLPLLLLLPLPLDKSNYMVHGLQAHAVLRARQDHTGLQNQDIEVNNTDKFPFLPDLLHLPPLLRVCRSQYRGCLAPLGQQKISQSIGLPTRHSEPKETPEAQSLPLEFDSEPWMGN